MKEYTGSFSAVGDDGFKYSVDTFTDVIDAGTFGNPTATIKGLKELQTSEGLAVNREKKGFYRIVQTGVLLRSDSPDAP